MAIKHKVRICTCPTTIYMLQQSTIMYVIANTCTQLSAPLLDSTKLQQSVAAHNLNDAHPLHYDSVVSLNNGCTIQQ
jgi:hypothetical protein